MYAYIERYEERGGWRREVAKKNERKVSRRKERK